MAFQQQHRAPAPRHVVYEDAAPPRLDTSPSTRQPQPQESREWVLFSPAQPALSSPSIATPPTLPHSNFSYFDSIDTPIESRPGHVPDLHEEEEVHEDDAEEEDDEDLDSLDDGLHAFNDPGVHGAAGLDQSATVLPAHDGLGTFPGNSSTVQASLWQHERYNPQKQRRPHRSALQKQFDALEEAVNQNPAEDEKTQFIEKWRLDQSRAILEEIEKEAKRVKRKSKSTSSAQRNTSHDNDLAASQSTRASSVSAGTESTATVHSEPAESWWQRFTRQIIQNLIGIDDATLSFIFRDSVETDAKNAGSTAEMIAHADQTLASELEAATKRDHAVYWQDDFLARIARELGQLMHQISEHPGAFETFLKVQEEPAYAGLPDSAPPKRGKAKGRPRDPRPSSTPHFAPTLDLPRSRHRRRVSAAADPSLWGIEEEQDGAELTPTASNDAAAEEQIRREKDYWEKDLDIKMVFGFLKSRLSSSSSSSSSSKADPKTHHDFDGTRPRAHSSAANPHSGSLRRAALIRHHHPLVASSSSATLNAIAATATMTEQQQQHARRPSTAHSAANPLLSPILGRRGSVHLDGAESRASQSTKRSKTRHSGSFSLGSSRNYWDIGASSIGSGPALSAGAWGEV